MTTLGHHIIRFIQHENLNFFGIDNPPLEPIHDLAGGANDNVRVQFCPPFDGLPRQCQPHLEPLHMRRHGSDRVLKDLHRQLSRGGDNQRLARGRRVDIYPVQRSDDECGSFPRSGLRLPDDIPGRIRQYPRQRLLLNGRGAFEPHLENRLEQMIGEFELLKRLRRREVRRLIGLDDLQAIVAVFLLTIQGEPLQAFGKFLRRLLLFLLDFLLLLEFGLCHRGGRVGGLVLLVLGIRNALVDGGGGLLRLLGLLGGGLDDGIGRLLLFFVLLLLLGHLLRFRQISRGLARSSEGGGPFPIRYFHLF
mmetsp:Transcript_17492/g.42046  ORF Transcript_17492/g.42046 Transcript_17492/m.42046 type:complete len:306 (+) Transcript_17492:1060-1977(+)